MRRGQGKGIEEGGKVSDERERNRGGGKVSGDGKGTRDGGK